MASIDSKISKAIGANGTSQIIVRLTINRNFRPCFKSGVFVESKYFKSIDNKYYRDFGNFDIFPPKRSKLNFIDVKSVTDAKNNFDTFKNRLLKICQVTEAKNMELSKTFIENALRVTAYISTDNITYNFIVDTLFNETRNEAEKNINKKNFFALFEEYIQKQQLAFDQIKGYHVLLRTLSRYEESRRILDKEKNFKLDIDKINKETIEDFRSYVRNEKNLADEYPKIFEKLLTKYPIEINIKGRSPKLVERGNNTVIKLMKKFKTFFNWLNKQGITNNRPFDGVTIGTEIYGTPIYITLEERNTIATFDFSERPELAIQRDIFIFQCCIGCRVGDLLKMRKSNIVNDAIEYIPRKTKSERPVTLHIPLNNRAKAILERYKDYDTKLFPFITAQKYNNDIKAIFKFCGITRMVTVLNPTTGEEEQRPINEIASSHMARRTFIGNLYKKIKDPNLICPLSGHKEGSKAFARYREIDDDIKKQVVSLID